MSWSGLAGGSIAALGLRWPTPGSQLGLVMLYEFKNFAYVYFGLKWLLLGLSGATKHMSNHLADLTPESAISTPSHPPVHAQERCACTRVLCMHKKVVHARSINKLHNIFRL